MKYAWEALRLQFQLIVLPPALSHQVKSERYVNTHGGPGRNIPPDLHNEHMNKLFKEIIASMGANLTENATRRAARSVTTLSKIRLLTYKYAVGEGDRLVMFYNATDIEESTDKIKNHYTNNIHSLHDTHHNTKLNLILSEVSK